MIPHPSTFLTYLPLHSHPNRLVVVALAVIVEKRKERAEEGKTVGSHTDDSHHALCTGQRGSSAGWLVTVPVP